MKPLLNEFRAFILRGNVIELAVAIVIGFAFAELVNAAVRALIAPLLTLILASKDGTWFLDFKYLKLGSFLMALINFLITAAVVFFVFVKPLSRISALYGKKDDAVVVPPATLSDVVAELREVKDELRKARGASSQPPPAV